MRSGSFKTENVWQSETLLFDGDAFFESIFRDIENAKTSVAYETYIYRDDIVGRRLSEALIRAAARGVTIRLIVDGIGASGWHERHAPALEARKLHVRIYHPVLFLNLWTRIKLDLGLHRKRSRFKGSAFLASLNRRDHRKMCVIDDHIGYVGSVNVTDDHCASIVGDKAWRDTSVRVVGDAASELTTAFDDVWERCHDARGRPRWRERLQPRPRRLFSRFVRFNYTSRLRRKMYRQLVRRISNAKSRVWITNAYFAPSSALVRALKRAANNGADVRILVPRTSDVFFMPWVATSYYALVLKGGAKIYEYLPRMLHAKTAIIDDWMTVGSSNFNRRSLIHDFEVDVILSQNASRAQLVEAFERDLASSDEVVAARGGLTAWVGRLISRLLKNWI